MPIDVYPLHPVYREFWVAQEKSLLVEIQRAESGSIRQLITNGFYLKAQQMLALLRERDSAIIMGWPLYCNRANQIAAQFDTRLSYTYAP